MNSSSGIEPAKPSALAIGIFWASFTLGTLTSGFGLLLAQVPRVIFTLDYFCWSAVMLLAGLALLAWMRMRSAGGASMGITYWLVFVVCGELVLAGWALVSLLFEA